MNCPSLTVRIHPAMTVGIRYARLGLRVLKSLFRFQTRRFQHLNPARRKDTTTTKISLNRKAGNRQTPFFRDVVTRPVYWHSSCLNQICGISKSTV